jgi:AraC-like DNA-binding protein
MDISNERPKIVSWRRDPASYAPFPAGGADANSVAALFLEQSVITPSRAIEWKSSPEWRLGPRTLQNSMWMLVLNGEAKGWIGDPAQMFSIRKHDFIFFPAGVPHDVIPGPDRFFRYINVHFTMELYAACDVMHLLNLRGRYRACGHCLFAGHTQALARIFAAKPAGWKRSMSACIFQVMAHLCYYHADNIGKYCGKKTSANLVRLIPAFDAVENGLNRAEFGVKDMSKAIAVSEVCLRKLFAQSLGINPNAYIRQKRIDRACRLLRESAQSIDEISDVCGFRDRYYFHKTFKLVTGTTPRKYRQLKDSP